jgi:hypothetical protein
VDNPEPHEDREQVHAKQPTARGQGTSKEETNLLKENALKEKSQERYGVKETRKA